MDTNTTNPPNRVRTILGWSVLVLGLPLAVAGMLVSPNEYADTLGLDAVDCDGPSGVTIVALPAFFLYAAGAAIHARRWRRPISLVTTLACLAICTALAVNLDRAGADLAGQPAVCGDGESQRIP